MTIYPYFSVSSVEYTQNHRKYVSHIKKEKASFGWRVKYSVWPRGIELHFGKQSKSRFITGTFPSWTETSSKTFCLFISTWVFAVGDWLGLHQKENLTPLQCSVKTWLEGFCGRIAAKKPGSLWKDSKVCESHQPTKPGLKNNGEVLDGKSRVGVWDPTVQIHPCTFSDTRWKLCYSPSLSVVQAIVWIAVPFWTFLIGHGFILLPDDSAMLIVRAVKSNAKRKAADGLPTGPLSQDSVKTQRQYGLTAQGTKKRLKMNRFLKSADRSLGWVTRK